MANTSQALASPIVSKETLRQEICVLPWNLINEIAPRLQRIWHWQPIVICQEGTKIAATPAVCA